MAKLLGQLSCSACVGLKGEHKHRAFRVEGVSE